MYNKLYYNTGDHFTDDKLCLNFTVKVCEKQQIIREKKREQVRREKDALNILSNSGSSFFVKLYCTFQDAERLCILFKLTFEYYNFVHKFYIIRCISLKSICSLLWCFP